jgi:hypothetical protein
MANNWKLGAFFAGLAFCISFLFGLIGGVGFAVIILRAFLGALVFGALGFGVDILLRRLLPELFTSAGENGVDITVPGVNPHENFGEEDVVGEPEDVEELRADSYAARDEAGDLVEEIEELPHSEADTAGGATAFDGEVKSSGDEEEPEDLDVLPDMGELDASFAGSGEDESLGVIAKTSSRGNAKAAAITEENSPALIAKTLQTLLKRDSEG